MEEVKEERMHMIPSSLLSPPSLGIVVVGGLLLGTPSLLSGVPPRDILTFLFHISSGRPF